MTNEIAKFEIEPMATATLVKQMKIIKEIMAQVMQEGEHYGTIPGTKKPSLYKSGAEKLCMLFWLRLETKVETIDLGHRHREYRAITEVFNNVTGNKLANGLGSCCTMESKWRYRSENTGAIVPKEYWKTRNPSLLGGTEYSPRKITQNGKSEWYIFHRVEHDNPADNYNTCLKMAEKRSKVCAVLNATAASDIFTQDGETTVETEKTEEKKEQKKKPARTDFQKKMDYYHEQLGEEIIMEYLGSIGITNIDEITDKGKAIKHFTDILKHKQQEK